MSLSKRDLKITLWIIISSAIIQLLSDNLSGICHPTQRQPWVSDPCCSRRPLKWAVNLLQEWTQRISTSFIYRTIWLHVRTQIQLTVLTGCEYGTRRRCCKLSTLWCMHEPVLYNSIECTGLRRSCHWVFPEKGFLVVRIWGRMLRLLMGSSHILSKTSLFIKSFQDSS